MPQFSPDQVNFGDIAGYGAWDIGHGREHQQFVATLAVGSPSVLIPDFDLLTFLTGGGARSSIIQSHAQSHNLLNAALGITAIDMSVVDLDDQNSFYDWLGTHATNHAQIRQALGLT